MALSAPLGLCIVLPLPPGFAMSVYTHLHDLWVVPVVPLKFICCHLHEGH
jgi:hypothetical protein